ncbi:MAG: glycosyltransferase family 39 protein [Clostridia bacterium]|nr:glycosyltransferase family 39 protein [Clostridia bacterium]
MHFLLQGLSIVSMLAVIVIVMWRVLAGSGVSLTKKLPEVSRIAAEPPKAKTSAQIFGYAMLFRIFVLAVSFIIYCLFLDQDNRFQWGEMLDNWLKWDANNYIRISEGYTSYVEQGEYPTIVFFPLYPYLLKVVRFLIPNPLAAGLALSAVLSSFACVYLYKLVCLDYSRTTAKITVLLMSLFPFSFFNSAVMSESAFLLTTVMALYYARKNQWWQAGVCGFFATLSRSLGVFLVFPLFVHLIEENKFLGNLKDKKVWIKTIKEGAWLLLLPLAILVYLYINYNIAGDPFYFLEMEEKFWSQVSQPFFKTVTTFWDVLTQGHYATMLLVASFLPGFVLLISSYAILLWGATRHKTMYVVWFTVCLIVNSTMSWPLSFCRYMSTVVPLYMILADECEKHEKLRLGLLMSWSILFGVYFTGYLLSRQIM